MNYKYSHIVRRLDEIQAKFHEGENLTDLFRELKDISKDDNNDDVDWLDKETLHDVDVSASAYNTIAKLPFKSERNTNQTNEIRNAFRDYIDLFKKATNDKFENDLNAIESFRPSQEDLKEFKARNKKKSISISIGALLRNFGTVDSLITELEEKKQEIKLKSETELALANKALQEDISAQKQQINLLHKKVRLRNAGIAILSLMALLFAVISWKTWPQPRVAPPTAPVRHDTVWIAAPAVVHGPSVSIPPTSTTGNKTTGKSPVPGGPSPSTDTTKTVAPAPTPISISFCEDENSHLTDSEKKEIESKIKTQLEQGLQAEGSKTKRYILIQQPCDKHKYDFTVDYNFLQSDGTLALFVKGRELRIAKSNVKKGSVSLSKGFISAFVNNVIQK